MLLRWEVIKGDERQHERLKQSWLFLEDIFCMTLFINEAILTMS